MQYACPDCRATSNLHEPGCEYDRYSWYDIEAAYIDIISALSARPHTESELMATSPHFWKGAHDGVLSRLKREGRVEEIETDEEATRKLRLLTPDEYAEKREVPTYDDLQTIYEHGSVPGCHDDAVFALIAYYEMVGFTWERTRETVVDWLRESGAWDRGGFAEPAPEKVVDDKKHVYDESYGWKEAAQQAASVIEGRVA